MESIKQALLRWHEFAPPIEIQVCSLFSIKRSSIVIVYGRIDVAKPRRSMRK
jgi:hypothetical protein